jgi:hypothetical protein
MEYSTTHVQDALNLFLEQDREQPKLRAFFQCFLERYQALEDTLASNFKYSRLQFAFGSTLDMYGATYQVPRFTTDDEAYRRAIFIKILVSKCSATTNEILGAITIVTEAEKVTLVEYNAHIVVSIVKPKKLYKIRSLLNAIKPAGVSCTLFITVDYGAFFSTTTRTALPLLVDGENLKVGDSQLKVRTKSIIERGLALGVKIHTKHAFRLSDGSNYFVADDVALKIVDDARDIIVIAGSKLGLKITNEVD